MRKICLVTGATGGIGKWIALGLAKAGHHVILAGRDVARATAALAWILDRAPDASLEIVLADLSSLAATRNLGRTVAARHPRLDILVLNAGIFRARRAVTAEGHEMVLAVNYLSPVVLLGELEASLRAASPSRIVTIGSSTSDRARLRPQNLELTQGWTMVRAYSQSKLAVMIATFNWAKRLDGSGVTANVVHPGTVATGLIRSGGIIGLAWRLMSRWSKTEEQGAETPLYAALAPELANVTGGYFKDCRQVPPNPLAADPILAEQLHRAAERLLTPPPKPPA